MTKTVARRDSATSILRKLGVRPRDYDLFITKIHDQFEVEVTKAQVYLAGLKQVEAKDAVDTAKEAVAQDTDMDEVAPKTSGNPFNGLGQRKAPAAAPTKPAKKAKPAAKQAKAAPSKKEARVTMSSVARALILEGKTNGEVWEVISKQFELGETKKYYPGWFRFELRRKGHNV